MDAQGVDKTIQSPGQGLQLMPWNPGVWILNYPIFLFLTCKRGECLIMAASEKTKCIEVKFHVFEGYGELNKKILSVSTLSKMRICNILGTDQGINLKLSGPLLPLWVQIRLVVIRLYPTATTFKCECDCLQLITHLLVGTFRES